MSTKLIGNWDWFLTFSILFESLKIIKYVIINKHFFKFKDHANTLSDLPIEVSFLVLTMESQCFLDNTM